MTTEHSVLLERKSYDETASIEVHLTFLLATLYMPYPVRIKPVTTTFYCKLYTVATEPSGSSYFTIEPGPTLTLTLSIACSVDTVNSAATTMSLHWDT